MKVTYKNILFMQNLQSAISNLNLSADDYAVISKVNKLVKKLAPHLEDFQESVEDLKLDHCYKDGQKIVRENGQLQWTADGERAFRKSYKELLNKELDVDVEAINFSDFYEVLPEAAKAANKWEDVEETFSPFFVKL